MPSNSHATLHTALVWTMGLVLAAYLTGLALHGIGFGPVWESWFGTAVHNWLNLLTAWLPVAVCYIAVYRVGFRRPEVLLAAAGFRVRTAIVLRTLRAGLRCVQSSFGLRGGHTGRPWPQVRGHDRREPYSERTTFVAGATMWWRTDEPDQLHRRCMPVFGYGPRWLTRILRMGRALERARAGTPLAQAAATWDTWTKPISVVRCAF